MYGWQIALLVLGVIIFIVIAAVWSVRAHRQHLHAGVEELVDRTAEVKVALNPKGMVFIDDERWSAISESGPIEAGEEAVVTGVDGLILHVRKK